MAYTWEHVNEVVFRADFISEIRFGTFDRNYHQYRATSYRSVLWRSTAPQLLQSFGQISCWMIRQNINFSKSVRLRHEIIYGTVFRDFLHSSRNAVVRGAKSGITSGYTKSGSRNETTAKIPPCTHCTTHVQVGDLSTCVNMYVFFFKTPTLVAFYSLNQISLNLQNNQIRMKVWMLKNNARDWDDKQHDGVYGLPLFGTEFSLAIKEVKSASTRNTGTSKRGIILLAFSSDFQRSRVSREILTSKSREQKTTNPNLCSHGRNTCF